jgi:hypothetical protein
MTFLRVRRLFVLRTLGSEFARKLIKTDLDSIEDSLGLHWSDEFQAKLTGDLAESAGDSGDVLNPDPGDELASVVIPLPQAWIGMGAASDLAPAQIACIASRWREFRRSSGPFRFLQKQKRPADAGLFDALLLF